MVCLDLPGCQQKLRVVKIPGGVTRWVSVCKAEPVHTNVVIDPTSTNNICHDFGKQVRM